MVRLAACMFFMHTMCYAQPADRNHLQAILLEKQTGKDYCRDTSYIDVLNEMGSSCFSISADSVFQYAGRALAYARKAGYKRGEAVALRLMGNGHRLLGDCANALSYYFQSLTVAEKINDPELTGKACINVALEYADMHKNEDAILMTSRAMHYFEKTRDSANINKCLITIGDVWCNRKQYDSAMKYFQQAWRIAESTKNTYLLISSNDEVAVVLILTGRYKEAISIYLRAVEYYRHTNDQPRLAMAVIDVAWSYLQLRQYREAVQYGRFGMQLSSTLKATRQMHHVCKILAKAYNAMGDFRHAQAYQSLLIGLTDTLFNERIQDSTARLAARYEFEKRETLLREEQAKKDIRNKAIVKNQQLQIWFSATVIVFLSVMVFMLLRSRGVRQKTNRELAAMNSEIIRQKEEIEHQSYQLLLNNQQKDKLFSIIAHDLKAPLHSLNIVLDLLKTRALSEAQINMMIEELRRDVDFSSGLVNNLLFWANSQLNGIVAKPVVLNMQHLTKEVLELFAKQASDKFIVLSNELDPALQGYADKDMMNVVIRNLVSNAVKFCRPGDAITVTGRFTGNDVAICLTDTGIGIAPDTLEKINEKKIVTTCGTAGERGTGLGILLCREFVELNNGLFRIESKWGEGSRVCFNIPSA